MVSSLTTERTLELVAQKRRMLDETHSLIAMNRRHLNPWWGASGGSADDGRGGAALLSVRSRLERGSLVPAPHQVLVGHGTGKACVMCTQKIYPDEVENETSAREGDGEIKRWAHLGCFQVWRWASRVFEAEHLRFL